MPTNKQRLSINLSAGEYAELAALAEQNHISMAWIGHKAVITFLEQTRSGAVQLPLTFGKIPDVRVRVGPADTQEL